MSLSRRSVLKIGAGAGAALVLDRLPAFAQQPVAPQITKVAGRTGQRLPIIGLGSVSTFTLTPASPDWAPAQQVMRLFYDLGGRVIDSAHGYENAENFIGDTFLQYGHINDVFLATKFNAIQVNRGGGVVGGPNVRVSGGEAADKAVMEEQMAGSLAALHRTRVDLQQIWNLGDAQSHAQASSEPAGFLQWHLDKAREWKQAGKTKYIGITTSRDPQYAELEQAIRKEQVDFIQLDLAINDPLPEQRLLPAALDTGTGVLVNKPFGTGALFREWTARSKVLPGWAAEIGVTTPAQFFLKYIVSHPAITAALPATNDPAHLRDNMMAGVGVMPDAAMRKRMLDFWNA